MIELARTSDVGWKLGYGGDTLNTAIHLARFKLDTAFMTALGDDPLSHELRTAWAIEGLDTSLIATDPVHPVGLYAISTNAAGERNFSYWRDNSAARHLFTVTNPTQAIAAAEQADVLVYSLISLAILPPEGCEAMFDLCRRVRAHGGIVAFDGNYRPQLWPSPFEARVVRDHALRCADIGLPTLEDEMLLSPGSDANTVAMHWKDRGVGEVLVKLGARGCRLPDGTIVPPPQRLAPIDTSGAGDAFNAGYLNARLRGEAFAEAAYSGQQLAGWVVMQHGAIPAQTCEAPYSNPDLRA